jgi:hypothetical protein
MTPCAVRAVGSSIRIGRANPPRNCPAGRNANPNTKAGERVAGLVRVCLVVAANADGREARPAHHRGVSQWPAPEAQRRVAQEVRDYSLVAENLLRHHTQRLTDTLENSEQVASIRFGFDRVGEPTEVAEHHRHVRLLWAENRLRLRSREDLLHGGREELAQPRLIPLKFADLAQ